MLLPASVSQSDSCKMFKILVVVCALAGLSAAVQTYGGHPHQQPYAHAPVSHGDEAHAEIKSLHSDVHAEGFDYALETSNGIHAQASGDAHGNMHGDYYYTSPEGVPVKVSYTADENGYHPQSDLLPTSPPIPAAILKALEYIRTHPPHEEPHPAYNVHGHVKKY